MNRVVQDPTADAILKYINHILMEEELEDQTCILQDSAIQDAEKPFYDILAERYSPSNYKASPNQNPENQTSKSSMYAFNSVMTANNMVTLGLIRCLNENGPSCLIPPSLNLNFPSSLSYNSSTSSFPPASNFSVNTGLRISNLQAVGGTKETWELNQHGNEVILDFANSRVTPKIATAEKRKRIGSACELRDFSSNNFEVYGVESEQIDMCDKALLYIPGDHSYARFSSNEAFQNRPGRILHQEGELQSSARGKIRRKDLADSENLVDIRTLLIHCAEAVASNDHKTATEILMQIRQYSNPIGDGSQRKAFFFAKALEARLAGIGNEAALNSKRVPSVDILKAFRLLISACPFMNMSYFYSTETTMELAEKADRLHIIHFGITYCFPWISLIQNISKRSGRPPVLRITAIELPQHVFYPTVNLEETGQRLASYCERFHVPFEYNWVSSKWESVRLEDLKIDRNEVIAVNCLYRFRHLLDETVVFDGQRDAVLKLIKKINPDVFIHGIVNGAYNSPFFMSRFREALFYYSSMFDMFESIAGRGDLDRMVLEQGIYGKEILNVIACEGSERHERPETYRQWQIRNKRAGFKQLPLKEEIVQKVREQVNLYYHKDFLVDQDGQWMLQGWKGRILFAISCWKSS